MTSLLRSCSTPLFEPASSSSYLGKVEAANFVTETLVGFVGDHADLTDHSCRFFDGTFSLLEDLLRGMVYAHVETSRGQHTREGHRKSTCRPGGILETKEEEEELILFYCYEAHQN